jgi:glutathione S-transferase
LAAAAAAIRLHRTGIASEAALAPPPSALADYDRSILFGAGPLAAAVSNRAMGPDAPVEKRGMMG